MIRRAIGYTFFLSTVFVSCQPGASEKASNDTYQQAKETLAEREAKSPTRFLEVTVKDKRNLIGQTVIRGELRSNASVATYQDIEVELRFYSKTGALLEKDVEVIYDAVGPGKTQSFKTKYFAPKGTDSVGASIVKAQVAPK